MRFSILFLLFFLFLSPLTIAVDITAKPKGGTYKNVRVISLKSDSKNAKIMWTRNPNEPMDESFIYEKPIKILYTQEIWFFAFNNQNEFSEIKKEKYVIRKNPNRYSKKVFISSFSPLNNFITLKNTSNKKVNLKNWSIISRNSEKIIENLKIPAHSEIKIHFKIGDLIDRLKLLSPDKHVKDFVRYKIQTEKNITLHRDKKERRIFLNDK